MDPQTAQMILIGAGGAGAAKPTAELVKEFTLRIFGPPADEIGKLLSSPFARLNERRAARAAALIAQAAVVVAHSDAEPRPVPDYLLLPLLTHGSLIDDSDLQGVWAQLLASAATDAATVSPAFPQILSELSAKDVVMLSGLIGARELEHYERLGTHVHFEWEHRPFGQPGATPSDYVARENLIRLGLVRREPPDVELEPEKLAEMLVKMQRGQPVFRAKLNEERFGPRYSITALGIAFVSACAGPNGVRIKPEPRPEQRDSVGT